MTALLKRDEAALAIGVTAAFASRFVVLVVGRPDFVGWFNHSPYYWVQTRSLMEGHGLAYGDMPLLFMLYAGIAKIFCLSGMSIESAIIVASRLVMITVPALIPITMYLVAKKAADGNRLSGSTNSLIVASGFLPLTFANMPEHLQKNMIGLLLLAWSFLALFQWLRERKAGQLAVFSLLLVTTCLAHLGSALAALLLVAAVSFDILLRRASLPDVARIGLLSIAVVIAVAIGISKFDPEAAKRVFALVVSLIPNHPGGFLISIVAISVWLGVLLMIWRWFARRAMGRNEASGTFGRVVILWIGLLAMPLWPGEIGIRLLLFMPLGAVLLLTLAQSMFREARLVRYVATATAVVFVAMSGGEAVSLLMLYPNKSQTSAQLADVAEKYALSEHDLVITPYGVNPIANWFLGTKGSLLSAVERDVMARYDRVFVLNTLERQAPSLAAGECRRVQSADARYWATRHDIPLDEAAMPDANYDMFAFYPLEEFPEIWVFDDDGLWTGWGDCSPSTAMPPEA